MRIVHFNSGGKEFTGREYQYDAHHVHMIDELKRAGHEVLHVNPAALLGRYDDAGAYSEATVDAVRAFHVDGGCDLFFGTVIDDHLLPEAVAEIGRWGVPTINLNMDDLTHPYRVKRVTPAFDLVWTSVRENMDLIRSFGARKLVQMPFAANPHTFYPARGEEEARDICFIGACYGARARAIGAMGGAGIDVAVYGRSPFEVYGGKRTPIPALRALFYWQEGWQRLFRSLSYKSGRDCIRAGLLRSIEPLIRKTPEKHLEAPGISYHEGPSFADMPKVFARSALSLGSMEAASTFVLEKPLMNIRFREFEAAMSGAAHLANDYPELKECYEEDREMIFYDGFDDLVEKVRFWLRPENDAARRAIRVAARHRSEAEHTWRARLRHCLAELGIAAEI